MFHNDGTGTEEDANYEVQVLVNRRLIATSRIEGHNRGDGWVTLVEKLLMANINSEE